MKSFEIKIEVKRPRKIYKVMDYLIMFGVVLIASVVMVFLPYTSRVKKIAASEESGAIANARLTQLRRNQQEITSNSEKDKEYKANYDLINESILPVHEYLQSLNDFANNFELIEDANGVQTPRYSIVSQTVTGNVITLSIVDNGQTNRVPEFKDALIDNEVFVYYHEVGGNSVKETVHLDWISKIVMGNTISNNSVSLEVYYGK